MLHCTRLRLIAPHIPADTFLFFVLAASHADEYGTAFAGIRHFTKMGYSSNEVSDYFRQLEQYGLLRFIRKGERDPQTQMFLPNVYQFNPALYYIRRGFLATALAKSPQPFNALPGLTDAQSLISNPPSNRDHNQLVKPTPDNQCPTTNINEPRPPNQNQNRPLKERTASRSGILSASPSITLAGDPLTSRAAGRPYSEYGNPDPAEARSTASTSAERAVKPSTPSPGSAAPPSQERLRKLCAHALADPDDEYLAAQIATRFGTRHKQAREIVVQYGRSRVLRVYQDVLNEMHRGTVKNPVGLLRHRLKKQSVSSAGYEPVDWEGVRSLTSLDQWEKEPQLRQGYLGFLERPDCPAWFRKAFTSPFTDMSARAGD